MLNANTIRMKKKLSIFLLLAQVVVGIICVNAQNLETPSHTSMPLRGNGMKFTQNKGQIIDMGQQLQPDVLFKGNGGGVDVYIRKTGISYVLTNMGEAIHEIDEQTEELEKNKKLPQANVIKTRCDLMKKQMIKIDRIDVDFVNCNPNAETITADQVEGYTNYYYPHCSDGITHVNSFNELTLKNIYNNIDIQYYRGKANGLKYNIIVNPGANPDNIKLRYTGAKIKLESVLTGQARSKLKVQSSLGTIVEYMPKVYQNINGHIIDVRAEYKLDVRYETRDVKQENAQPENSHISDLTSQIYEVSFEFGTWNSSYALIIDPWVSYYGGSSDEVGYSVTTDPSGNVAFTGWTQSLNLPVSAGAFQLALGAAAATNTFVVKMDVAGGLVWATYYGGSTYDRGEGIAADTGGNILVAGTSQSANFPVGSSGANVVHQSLFNSGANAFLIKFDPAGVRLFTTLYSGSSGGDAGNFVTADGSDNIYLYGQTQSTNAIATPGAFQTTLSGPWDVFVAKFAPNGTRTWGTYLGGTGGEWGGGITVDKLTGNIYAAGQTSSNNFPVLAGFQMTSGWGFLFKFSTTGARIWATYYNGAVEGVTTDWLGNVIIDGQHSANTGVTSVGAFQTIFGGGGYDGYIAKFNSTGARQWGTLLGGNNTEYLYGGVDVDANNNIYVYGEWEDNDAGNYPISSCAYQKAFGGGNLPEDQFIAKYNANGSQRCITYIGGTGEDDTEYGGSISVHGNYIYITGCTTGGYPTSAGAFQTVYGGIGDNTFPYGDAFIDQLCINLCEAKVLGLNYTANTTNVCTNTPVTFTPSVNNTCDTTGYKFLWTFTGGTPSSSTLANPAVTYNSAGTYTTKLVLTTACKKDSITKTAYITASSCSACTLSAEYIKGTSNCAHCGCKEWIIITASNGAAPYTYSWPDGYDKRYINKLCPGNYTVKVIDKNGCSVNLPVSTP
jgi:PKD repeat protein